MHIIIISLNMLYTKGRKLDPGVNTELRILKMEDQRVNTLNLLGNLKHYCQALEQLSVIGARIVEDLNNIYSSDSTYGDIIFGLSKALTHKTDIIKREVKSIRDSIDKNKDVGDMYNPLRPLIKHYFKSIDENLHYEQKLPKIIDQMEGKKKLKGELTLKETEKIVRNKRKRENTQTDLKVVHESIQEETNKMNLERFDKLNPITRSFISCEVSLIYLLTEKFGVLEDFDHLLTTKESGDFNDKYFMDMKVAARSQFQKNNERIRDKSREPSQTPVKQNIQNNYYYLNSEGNQTSRQNFSPEDSNRQNEGRFIGNLDNKPDSSYNLNNSIPNMIGYQNTSTIGLNPPLQNNSGFRRAPDQTEGNAIPLPYE